MTSEAVRAAKNARPGSINLGPASCMRFKRLAVDSVHFAFCRDPMLLLLVTSCGARATQDILYQHYWGFHGVAKNFISHQRYGAKGAFFSCEVLRSGIAVAGSNVSYGF